MHYFGNRNKLRFETEHRGIFILFLLLLLVTVIELCIYLITELSG